ncbi:MAG: hypothetical protein IPK25_14785 [Saprospiraceae bacterium]|nr:hypothetical protein [Saprospiraceae bacterium]
MIVAVVGVDGRLIPVTKELPVVSPTVPPRMLFAVAFPIVFPVMVTDAAMPEIMIPDILPETAAVVPELVNAPIVLF